MGAVVVGLLAGIYPSFYLSFLQACTGTKRKCKTGEVKAQPREVFWWVFQFAISIVLIIGTFVINKQMNYVLTKKLGYNKDHVLLLQGTHTLGDKVNIFKNELLRLTDVKYVSISGFLPIGRS